MAGRAVALVVAIGLIVAAFAYRDRDRAQVAGGDGDATIVCASDFADLCSDLAGQFDDGARVVIEPAGTTYDRLVDAGPAPDIDLWLVAGPFPTMVDEARRRAARAEIVGETERVGGARIGMTVWKDRAEVMRRSCGVAELTWKCVGDVGGRGTWEASGGRPEWGVVKVGLPAPDHVAAGTVALGAATAGFFDSTRISSVDLAENDAYRQWLGGLAAATKPEADLVQMLSAGPAALDMYIGLEPAMQPVVAGAFRGRDAAVIYPAPVAATDIRLAAVGRGKTLPDDVRDRIERALREANWTGRADGLPSPGLLDALRTTWRETYR